MGKLFLIPLEICLLIYSYGSHLIKKTTTRFKGVDWKCDDVRMLRPSMLFQMLGDLNRLYIIYVNSLIFKRYWYLPIVQLAYSMPKLLFLCLRFCLSCLANNASSLPSYKLIYILRPKSYWVFGSFLNSSQINHNYLNSAIWYLRKVHWCCATVITACSL